ncbi:Oidioi.mRNA.OKI2018_I69.chr2.g3985.t1.cds [Oikopleura dioica]|uniref:Oidioi.mRNA.OKI2018_I69.chr2.g3985.t1.cds n=1 Tax=Oikopleura dioica TaxID=34765 RepID=A0ABN7T1E6_OIKDI|nr:Oidioi.mRNA.OKI2018_I69.chr2.g3985.t1.cds [Oikopleura dioica]
MGEVRKRKASGEAEAKAPEKEVVFQKQGMGFFSVVFVAAILAGSGCHVLKKDQAAEFDAVRGLAAQLKADNAKTLSTIASMQEGLEAKDSIIKRLQEEVTATHEKNALLKDELKELNEDIESTEVSLKADIEAKWSDQYEELKRQAEAFGKLEQDMLDAVNTIELLEQKLGDLQETVEKSSEENDARTKSMSELQSELESAKTETASKLIQLHELVSTSGVDTEKIDGQAAQILKVQESLAALEKKLEQDSAKLAAEIAKSDVSSDLSALENSIKEQKQTVENLLGALQNAAKAEDVAKIASLAKDIQQALFEVEQSKVNKDDVAPLRAEFETAIKQLSSTLTALSDTVKSSDLKYTSELAALSKTIENLKFPQPEKTD